MAKKSKKSGQKLTPFEEGIVNILSGMVGIKVGVLMGTAWKGAAISSTAQEGTRQVLIHIIEQVKKDDKLQNFVIGTGAVTLYFLSTPVTIPLAMFDSIINGNSTSDESSDREWDGWYNVWQG